jgi:hypothetical protein
MEGPIRRVAAVFGPAVFIREIRNCFAKMPFSLAPAAARARSPISASRLGRTRLRDLWNRHCIWSLRAEIRPRNQRWLIVKNNRISQGSCPPSPSSKNPARFPARAQLAQFASFNFTNNLICAVGSSTILRPLPIRGRRPQFSPCAATEQGLHDPRNRAVNLIRSLYFAASSLPIQG